MMQCDQCNGSGQYTGLFDTEPCQTCGGVGTLSEAPNKDTILDNLPDWMEDYKDQLDITHKIKPSSSVQLDINDIIFVYNNRWCLARMTSLDATKIRMSYSDNTGTWNMSIVRSKVCWNVTQNRWEYIASGTPTW